jgi:hypothetical protein
VCVCPGRLCGMLPLFERCCDYDAVTTTLRPRRCGVTAGTVTTDAVTTTRWALAPFRAFAVLANRRVGEQQPSHHCRTFACMQVELLVQPAVRYRQCEKAV